MGACFNSIDFLGDITPDELRRKFSSHCSNEEHEHGHSGYNGTLSTTDGLKIEQRDFPNREEAEEYIADNTNKRGHALAVKYAVVEEVVKKEPTFEGKTQKEIGVYHSEKTVAEVWRQGNARTIPADQLSEEEKEKVKNLHKALKEATRATASLEHQMRVLASKVQMVEEEFTEEDFKSLKKTRRELKKAREVQRSAEERFRKMDDRIGKRILQTEKRNAGTRWLVGGWAAE